MSGPRQHIDCIQLELNRFWKYQIQQSHQQTKHTKFDWIVIKVVELHLFGNVPIGNQKLSSTCFHLKFRSKLCLVVNHLRGEQKKKTTDSEQIINTFGHCACRFPCELFYYIVLCFCHAICFGIGWVENLKVCAILLLLCMWKGIFLLLLCILLRTPLWRPFVCVSELWLPHIRQYDQFMRI